MGGPHAANNRESGLSPANLVGVEGNQGGTTGVHRSNNSMKTCTLVPSSEVDGRGGGFFMALALFSVRFIEGVAQYYD